MNLFRATYLSQPMKQSPTVAEENLRAVLCPLLIPPQHNSTVFARGTLLRNSLQLQQLGISLLDVQRKKNRFGFSENVRKQQFEQFPANRTVKD